MQCTVPSIAWQLAPQAAVDQLTLWTSTTCTTLVRTSYVGLLVRFERVALALALAFARTPAAQTTRVCGSKHRKRKIGGEVPIRAQTERSERCRKISTGNLFIARTTRWLAVFLAFSAGPSLEGGHRARLPLRCSI